MFEMPVNVYDDDMKLFQSPSTSPDDLQEHLSFIISVNRRKTEVNIRDLTAEERTLVEEATDTDCDPWNSNSVLKKFKNNYLQSNVPNFNESW